MKIRWSENELSMLRDQYPLIRVREIKINRSIRSIYKMAQHLQLKSPPRPCSEITRKKISAKALVRMNQPESKANISQSMKSYIATHGHPRGMLGKKHKPETIDRMKAVKMGSQNKNWNGGVSRHPYSFLFSPELKLKIRTRDNFICQRCGEKEIGKSHTIHHIDYDKQNCTDLNLITLCSRHNSEANFNRPYWTNFYQEKLLHGSVI